MKNRLFFILYSLFLFLTVSLFSDVSPCVEVTGEGVGIGTTNPQEMLDVNGRIRDQSGIVMPVGSIIPFAGNAEKVPDGWLLCNGRAMSSNDYLELYDTIGTNFGNGSTDTRPVAITGDFNLPDLRGMFLRGVDDPDGDSGLAPAGIDPQEEELQGVSANGGNSGGAVGSRQEDAFQGWQGAIGGKDDGDPIYFSKNRLDNYIVTGTKYPNHGWIGRL